jgi:hypothetical protein
MGQILHGCATTTEAVKWAHSARQPRQPETIVCSAHNLLFDLELKEEDERRYI